ncbi:CWF19-like protein 2 [Corythoichthys intestinalis]|uniref:CWF19-like protein 2 n=1 Tax=Corythoichthys intestinalis TaxID=161448 RepID=UPI0025A636B5|nr:CWF19-like protein 2 [Corythoichthys intestinalis]XP_057695711.1 CWF19-like protein 2 [Corythoichthys intestinalis]XP_061797797.1 CWF19-like protein 2 [Nerophis lumbriciformis]
MAAHVNFESTSSIADRKESKRQARQEAVERAKQQYEREERRKELKRQRGEDTWMLPEVTDRLKEIEDETTCQGKKKKLKKSKKKKEKKKKAKKEKKATEAADGSSDGSNDSADEWVEAQPQPQPLASNKAWKVSEKSKAPDSNGDSAKTVQRDEWMTFDFLAMKTTSTAQKRAEKDQLKEEERAKAQAIEQAGLHKLELNPYWKDGGTGLPPEEKAGSAATKVSVVNDGGLSWLRKSYQRMKEQAEREQRSLNDVVADRYGSMEEFQQRLAEAEKAVYGYKSRGEGENMSKSRQFEGKESRERWRRKGEEMESDRWRRYERHSSPLSHERGGDQEKVRDQDSERNPNKDKDRYREREKERDEERERSRYRARSSVTSSSEKKCNQRSSSLGSLKGRFLKPSDDDDSRAHGPPPHRGQSFTGFLKPNLDDEDSGPRNMSGMVWRKGGSLANEPDHMEKEKVRDIAKSTPAPCDKTAAATIKSSESGSDEEVEELPLLSEEEMNKLGAKLVKAEIMGNTAMVEKLKAQLDAAHKAKESNNARKKLHETAKSTQMAGSSSEDREVLLFRTDHSGQAWPVKPLSEPQEPHGGRRKKKAIETHVDGQRVRYFQDDDSVGLKEMVRREKMSSAQDQNALYSRMAAKVMGKTDGDNYTLDDMFVSSAARKEGEGREEERLRNRASEESRRLATSMEKCRHCFSSQELQKHLIVAIGSKVYLSLPAGVSMTEGHCLICPLQHHCSATTLDEDVWSEIQLFRRSLVRMFESQELDCVFMEMHLNPRRRQHMVLECIPLPRELGDMAPIYFKKAIMECDEEWAMNKKVVDLSSKDIRKAVPRGLPYFAVDFGLQGGFAHVIENEQKFPHYFGKEVVGGMMDLEPRIWRKLIRENFDDQRKKVLQFAQWWKQYDCTKNES